MSRFTPVFVRAARRRLEFQTQAAIERRRAAPGVIMSGLVRLVERLTRDIEDLRIVKRAVGCVFVIEQIVIRP